MRRMIMLAVAVAMLAAGCGDDTVEVGDDADTGTVEVVAGERLKVRLRESPTTGYEWEVAEYGPLVLEDRTYKVDDPDLDGSPGVVTFTFIAPQPGTGSLVMIHHRPWEEDEEPIDTYTLTVTVTAPE
jgi:inhibitor of cysteine peptidase